MEYKGANYTLIRQLPVYTQDGFSKQYSKLTNKYWESVCTKKKESSSGDSADKLGLETTVWEQSLQLRS